MHIVAGETGDSARVHDACYEIVALHPVLVSSAVGEMGKCSLAELVFFKLPELAQIQAYIEADMPVVIFSAHRVCERLALRMALDADVVRLNVVQPCGVDDVQSRRLRGMLASGAVAFFASHVPFGYLFG